VDSVADNEQMMFQMKEELARARSVERRDSDDCLAVAGQPIIVRSAERKFHLLATNSDEQQTRAQIATLASRLWNYRSDLQKILDAQGAPMRAVLSMNVTHANRALMKAGFNFFATILGPEIARLPLFARIRAAVLRNEHVSGCMINESELRRFAGLGEGASDAEAVGAGIFERALGEPAEKLGPDLLQPNVHTVVLGAGRLGVFVFVSLRGRPVARIPLLPRLPGFNINGIIAAWIVRSGGQPELVEIEQLDALRGVLHAWALQLSTESPTDEDSYVKAQSQPFVIEATYAPRAI